MRPIVFKTALLGSDALSLRDPFGYEVATTGDEIVRRLKLHGVADNHLSPNDEKAHILIYMLQTLGQIDDEWLRRYPQTPSIYTPGLVTYKLDAIDDEEHWIDIPSIIEAGDADCKSLASWRAAELRAKGIEAKTVVKWATAPGGFTVFHIIVLRKSPDIEKPPAAPGFDYERVLRPYQDGWWIEDPSRVLGMGAEHTNALS